MLVVNDRYLLHSRLEAIVAKELAGGQGTVEEWSILYTNFTFVISFESEPEGFGRELSRIGSSLRVEDSSVVEGSVANQAHMHEIRLGG